MEQTDEAFHRIAKFNGWVLPPPSSPLLRLPIIRSIRMLWYVEKHRDPMTKKLKNRDAWHAYAILRGWV